MPKIAAIIFLVSLLNLPAFFGKHTIDLTDMLLHLGKHPSVSLVKQVLYLLPVSITGLDFFSSLPDEIENEVESQCRFHYWSTLKKKK